MGDGSDGRVERRRVFYIPGYDPYPPRRYRELYRKEGAAQAALSGYGLTVGRGPVPLTRGWRAEGRFGQRTVIADAEVLVWSDLVRASMGAGIAATYWQMLRTAWVYVASGALLRLLRLRKGPVIAALYPVGMLLAQAGLALLAAWTVAGITGLLLPGVLAWALGLAAAVPVLRWFRRIDGRVYAHYLMHDYAYGAQDAGANPADLEARMAAFRKSIGAALDEGFDEVLVVGHSSGAHLAISILADLLREGVREGPALSLLTLGQVVPMVAFLPRATRLRADLYDLACSDRITWVDVTAPGDGCCFALCDPVAVTGVAPPGKRWPLVISAAFSRTLSEARWQSLRWRFFRLHFQYLCAFDALPGRVDDYDYFAITAGPLTLAARFAGRAPSRSRIDVAVSGHTSRAA